MKCVVASLHQALLCDCTVYAAIRYTCAYKFTARTVVYGVIWGAVCVKTIFLRKPPLFVPRFSFVATILFSRRRFPFRGDDSLFAATIVFSWRRFPFRGDDSPTIVFSWRRFSFRGDDSLFVATNSLAEPHPRARTREGLVASL